MLESKEKQDERKPTRGPTKAKLGLIIGLLITPLAVISTLGVVCAVGDPKVVGTDYSELGIPVAVFAGIPAVVLAVLVTSAWGKAR